jgi:hypothetical protein
MKTIEQAAKEKRDRLQEVCNHFVNNLKVVVKDIDGVVKESRITAIYTDYTVILSDCIKSEWSIFKITLLKLDQ